MSVIDTPLTIEHQALAMAGPLYRARCMRDCHDYCLSFQVVRDMQGSADEHTDLVVDHKCLSTLEASHKCAVAQLQWLPGWEVTARGALLTGQGARAGCNFFATCAADGRVFFWDWRTDLQRSKRRKNDGARRHSVLHSAHACVTWRNRQPRVFWWCFVQVRAWVRA